MTVRSLSQLAIIFLYLAFQAEVERNVHFGEAWDERAGKVAGSLLSQRAIIFLFLALQTELEYKVQYRETWDEHAKGRWQSACYRS